MDNETRAILEGISKRNPGALDVCFKMMDYLQELVVFDFEMLLEMNVLGSDLYDLYAHCCERDMARLHASIMQKTAIEQLRSVRGSTFYVSPS